MTPATIDDHFHFLFQYDKKSYALKNVKIKIFIDDFISTDSIRYA